MSYIYNIHNILSIKSSIELSLANSFTPPFDCFRINRDLEEYDLIISDNEHKKDWSTRYQKIAHGLFYSKEEDMIISDLCFFGLRMVWSIRNLFKKNTELRFNKFYNFFSKINKLPISAVYPLCLLIRNILQIKLLLKGATFIVGSAATFGKKGIIFAGIYGSGKTTTILNFMKYSQIKYLSNDLMIVSKDMLYGFPSLIPYRKYHFDLISYHGFLNPLEEFQGRILSSFKDNFDIYFLEISPAKFIKELPHEEGITKLCYFNNRIHSYFGERALSSISYLYKEYSLLNMQKKQWEILSNFFKDAHFYIISGKNSMDYIEILKKEKYTSL